MEAALSKKSQCNSSLYFSVLDTFVPLTEVSGLRVIKPVLASPFENTQFDSVPYFGV